MNGSGAIYTATRTGDRRFVGAKLALFAGDRVLVIRRDDIAGIPWPGHLDFPGGGREGAETAVACALRETREEIGLTLAPSDVVWRGFYRRPFPAWFFAARLHPARLGDIRFGEEGQGWDLMRPADYIGHAQAIPHFRPRLSDALAALD